MNELDALRAQVKRLTEENKRMREMFREVLAPHLGEEVVDAVLEQALTPPKEDA